MIIKPVENKDLFYEKASTTVGVFASKEWLSIYGSQLKLVGIHNDDQKFIGGFYYYQTSKMGASFVKLPPYTPHCGLFYYSEAKNQASVNSFSKEVVSEVCNYLSSLKSKLLVLAFHSSVTDMQPFIWAKYKVIPNYTYRIDLHKSLDDIYSNYDPKNRNKINACLKQEVIVKEDGLSKESMFDFFKYALQSAGANVYEAELKNIFLKFSNPTNSFCLSAFQNDILQGAVFCAYDNEVCYYLFGGLDKNAEVSGVTNLLLHKAIEKAKSLGCQTFDFEGSMLKGVEKFFRSFGPHLVPYFTINKASLPLEMLLKFKKRELF